VQLRNTILSLSLDELALAQQSFSYKKNFLLRKFPLTIIDQCLSEGFLSQEMNNQPTQRQIENSV
jgi:hypothetical protein